MKLNRRKIVLSTQQSAQPKSWPIDYLETEVGRLNFDSDDAFMAECRHRTTDAAKCELCELRFKCYTSKEISKEEAKGEIRQLFSSGRILYYSDVAEELGLDLELVVDICHELQESGELKIDEFTTVRSRHKI